ncbi:hypothetical protein CW705_09195 [Candidatus Bathyarchaeota archaeon]|nr:MAG: hypothetical protein CW705_09195 [Candidatus Bathyarchaeota archaeon]
MPLSIKDIIKLIKKCQKYYNVFVNFSGGRHSLVVLHLALKALREVKAVYIDTTITLPECNQYVNEVCERWGVELITLKREDIDFWDLVTKWGFPHRRFRWCMREFKSTPLRMFNDYTDERCLHLTGVTLSESNDRKRVYSIRGMLHFNANIHSYVLHPILYWDERMVDKYIRKYGLPVNPCYSIYGREGNCYYCPFITDKDYYLKLSERHPSLFKKIVEAEMSMKKGGAAIYLGRGKRLHIKDLVLK